MTHPGMRRIPDPQAEMERLAEARKVAEREVPEHLVRDILEALCRRDGLSLESAVESGKPARNYELADRLGIGHIFGLRGPS